MVLLVHMLACAFGLGSWVAVNGVWVELPLIVNTLPEGWELPSYLTVIIQLANLGPLLVTLMHKLYPGRLKERAVIYCILSIGVLSCILLAFFWDKTTIVAGASRSTAFFIITFFLALVDCTSSVTFLPFMMQLPAKYITTYYIGEGLSGFIPGVVALAQSVGIAKCVNSSQTAGNHTDGSHTEYLPPNFSTEVFFILLAVMMCISLAAFFALNRLPRTFELSTEKLVPDTVASVFSGLENPGAETDGEGGVKSQGEVAAQSKPLLARPQLSVYQLTFIYCLVVWVNCATNGVMPSVQTYSCKSYGNLAYHLSASLASVANPMACTIAMFFQNRSVVFLGVLTALGTGFGSYNMAMAAMSPCPLLQGSVAGEIIIVLSWLFFTGTLSYVKVMVGVILRDRSHSALVWCGAATQVGSLVGSVTMFPLINVYQLFKSGDFCNTQCPL
ncbi:solute carrier family 52, riboflavin transporter, member 3-A [Pseudoliparis swirei]|uniref:solute carrier family 52, riboflavin transporter, member 3-A n=1 Tax=Pseudoliparis swirei TaxID=2059687 RepID=UPI0024BEF35C|nr:solute carrier family 52, riboflavin transporter, member 3-A [Pseudoliparis swirei]XP_056278310.1 solute carrier family 52, riboflavin transporter, member 3-A [Pseudoliparis swirei]XP_056278311.1 solute carrier family 52, riboflavin transporter, member 3-A [Pseudoliparis swirei]XP_056278312.1 solute carrier family 52, riboflavin transporter, member 3-A [Pseudoliparis swirei]